MIKLGVLAEDASDVGVVRELVKKLRPDTGCKFRHFVGNGCGKLRNKCRTWAEQLKLQGCSSLVFIHDLDRCVENDLRKILTDALGNPPISKSVIIIPIEEIEAWLLCDGKALQKAFSLEKAPKLSGNPENIMNPKGKLEDLIWRSSKKRKRYINSIHNPAIARNASVDLMRKCSAFIKFEQFIRSV